jgi:hypothetical protein
MKKILGPTPLNNEKGIAMILVVSLIGLLSLFGVYAIQESTISHRITSAMARNEQAFQKAEGALEITLKCLDSTPPPLKFQELIERGPIEITDSQRLPDYIKTPPASDIESGIDYLDFNTTPPPGWSLIQQAYSGFYSVYFRARGRGEVPSRKGTTSTEICRFVERVLR